MKTLSNRKYEGHDAPDWATHVSVYTDSAYWEEGSVGVTSHRFQRVGFDSTYTQFYDSTGPFKMAKEVIKLPPKEGEPVRPELTLTVTQLFLDAAENAGTYFEAGDSINIKEGHRHYKITRAGKALHDETCLGSSDSDWVHQGISLGWFVHPSEAMPVVPKSELYHSQTGRCSISLTLQEAVGDASGHVAIQFKGILPDVRIDSETARAMASDLYRMARHLEKQEQKNG